MSTTMNCYYYIRMNGELVHVPREDVDNSELSVKEYFDQPYIHRWWFLIDEVDYAVMMEVA